MSNETWLVMDSRAAYDTDKASILECFSNGKPSKKYLARNWGDMDAWLCFVGKDGVQLVELIK